MNKILLGLYDSVTFVEIPDAVKVASTIPKTGKKLHINNHTKDILRS